MDLRIYQIDIYNDPNQVCFQPLYRLSRLQPNGSIDSSIYEKVFSGTVQANNLEDVFRIFNTEHPPEHAGRSLSVSDIVEVVSRSGSVMPGFYYCDSIGFQKVDFEPSKAKSPDLIKGILLEPGKEARIAEMINTSRAQEHIVGGSCDIIAPFSDNAILLRNAEGKNDALSFNRALRGNEVTLDLSYRELCQTFRETERSDPDIHTLGYIVFTEDSFSEPYSLESRTYAVSSNNKAFQANCGGYSIFGSNLDGTDPIIRLDAYMANEHGGKNGWKIERCYMKKPGPVLDTLMGTVFICGQNDGAYISLTQDQLQTYFQQFRYPERLTIDHETVRAEPYRPAKNAPSIGSRITDADNRRAEQPTTEIISPSVPPPEI